MGAFYIIRFVAISYASKILLLFQSETIQNVLLNPSKSNFFHTVTFIIKYLNAKTSYEKFCMLGRVPYFLMMKFKKVFSSFLDH